MQCNQLIEITLPILSSTEENQIAVPEITEKKKKTTKNPFTMICQLYNWKTTKQLRSVLTAQYIW